jgi:hypothetical protein
MIYKQDNEYDFNEKNEAEALKFVGWIIIVVAVSSTAIALWRGIVIKNR